MFDCYVPQMDKVTKAVNDRFALSTETRDRLRATRMQLADQKGAEGGLIRDPNLWEKVPVEDRRTVYGRLLADALAGRNLERADYPIPALDAAIKVARRNQHARPTDPQAGITVPESELVNIVDGVITELSIPQQFGRMLLGFKQHPSGAMSLAGTAYTNVAESYIFRPKAADGSYEKVAVGQVGADYRIEERGIQVEIDRLAKSIMAWDELANQIRLIAAGGARSINQVVYAAFLAAHTTPVAALNNIGGTGLGALNVIDSSVSPRDGVAGANSFLHVDYVRAAMLIGTRPNALPMKYIVMRPPQWRQAELWAVNQKIAFAQVLGAFGAWEPSPAYDGLRIPVTAIVDDDLPTHDALNIMLFVGPGDYVGKFVEYEPTTIAQLLDLETNQDKIPARQSNAAVITAYCSWVLETNLSLT